MIDIIDRAPFAHVRDAIARFNRREFAEQVALLSAELIHGKIPEARRLDGRTTIIAHHLLARVTLVSLVYGREHGASPSRDDVIDACLAWNSMDEPLWHAEDRERFDIDAFFIRMSWDQFPLQERVGDSFTIWFGIYRRARAAGILGESFDTLWVDTFGCPLADWYSAAMAAWLLWSMVTLPLELDGLASQARAFALKPVITRGELRTHMVRVGSALGPATDDIERVIVDLSQSREQLKAAYIATLPGEQLFERYSYNPLATRPVISFGPVYVAPVPRLFGNACGLATLYRLSAQMPEFPAIFGQAFESYVGEVLRASFAHVWQEPRYKVNGLEWRGFDWVVTEPDFTLVIECKTSRIRARGKATGDLEAMAEDLKRSITDPRDKFPDKEDHIRRGLTSVPADALKVTTHRLIVTLEDLHLDNVYSESVGIDPSDANAPIVVSISGLQRLLCVRDSTIHELIADYQHTYAPASSGSIDQWLKSDARRASDIQEHALFAEDRAILRQGWRLSGESGASG